ncbi:hypothetical protein JMUB7552_27520 [Staphylococcus aureus]
MSRGLGDVYKRQLYISTTARNLSFAGSGSVSYTHLTLPTTPYV